MTKQSHSSTPKVSRKRLTDERRPRSLEYLTAQELREAPGDVLTQVYLGKVYVVTRNGAPVAVLSPLPGENLTINYDGKGHVTYGL